MARRSVRDAKDHRTFKRAVIKQGGSVEPGTKHDVAYHPNSRKGVRLPRHRGDYATGTRYDIRNQLLALTFFCFTPICLIVWLINGLMEMYN